VNTRSTTSDLAEVLRDQRDRIVARFVVEVQRQELSPAGTKKSLLVDEIPRFLDEIVVELERAEGVRASQDAVATNATAREHGGQRWTLGYDLDAVIREYGILRHCIFEVALDAGADLSIRQADILCKCLNVGVAEAAMAYAHHRDAQLESEKADRAFLLEAGQLLASSLDYRSTLTRLTQLVIPRLADWCAIHLDGVDVDEMPIAHVNPTKVEVLRDIYKRFPLPRSSTLGAQHVMRTGESARLHSIAPGTFEAVAQSPEHLELLRSIGSCSWIIAPLRIQDNVFGAITLVYSESGRHYEEADLALAEELAQRAAVAIDNARLYRRSQEERSRVEAATRAKDEFVAMVSHELRTPMNAIMGWLGLFRRGQLTPERQERALEIIERNAQAQNQLIGDLLDISQVITGKLRIKPSQVDLTHLVEMAIEGVRPAADAKNIRIEAELETGSTIMRADGDRLQQVVWNLLTNAVKFTPKNGQVKVLLRRVSSDVELVVEDSGEGIAPEFLPHMFETFRQSDTSTTRPHGGLGIGLSIVKHLVELHGGHIEGRSPGKGQGATFVVRLPVSPLISATLGVKKVAARRPLPDRPAPPRLEGVRALVVEDDPDAQELLTHVLSESGIAVRAAGSAEEARHILDTYEPHVIISDVGLPGEDGHEFIRSIRTSSIEARKNIPALALTAFASNEDRARALVAGFNNHLAKPVDAGTLIAAIIELTGRAGRS
jgi:signal transduction histidine kinase/CheY-like chemotaxis protein